MQSFESHFAESIIQVGQWHNTTDVLQPGREYIYRNEGTSQQELWQGNDIGKERNGALAIGEPAHYKAKAHEHHYSQCGQDQHFEEGAPPVYQCEAKEEIANCNDQDRAGDLEYQAGQGFTQYNM